MHLVEAQNRNFDLDLLFEQFELDQALCAEIDPWLCTLQTSQRFLEDSLSAFRSGRSLPPCIALE